jgi:hypothetical protein
MGITLNLTAEEVKSAQGGFTPIAEGTYTAVIYSVKADTSKAGNPMYVFEFKLQEGPEIRKNYKIRTYATLTANALFTLVGINKAVGFPVPDKNAKPNKDGIVPFELKDPEDYQGLEVNVRIKHRDYNTVDENGDPEVQKQAEVRGVYKYDPSKITGAEGAAAPDDGVFVL